MSRKEELPPFSRGSHTGDKKDEGNPAEGNLDSPPKSTKPQDGNCSTISHDLESAAKDVQGQGDNDDSNDIDDDDAFEMMLPPWVKSDVPRFSIGWRMGGLEDHLHRFWDWYNSLTTDRQCLVQEKYPPNFMWRHFYDEKDYGSSDEEDYADL